jgi:hypothetical protein
VCFRFGALAANLKETQASGVLRHLGIKYANFVKADGTGFDVELAQGFAKPSKVASDGAYLAGSVKLRAQGRCGVHPAGRA